MFNLNGFKNYLLNCSSTLFEPDYDRLYKEKVLLEVERVTTAFLQDKHYNVDDERIKAALLFIRDTIFRIFDDYKSVHTDDEIISDFIDTMSKDLFKYAGKIIDNLENYNDIKSNFEAFVFKRQVNFLNDKTNSIYRSLLIDPDKLFEKLGVDQIAIVIGSDIVDLMIDGDCQTDYFYHIKKLREKLCQKYGIVLPCVRIMNTIHDSKTMQIYIRHRLVINVNINTDRDVVYAKQWNKYNIDIPDDVIIDINPYNEEVIYWVKENKLNNNCLINAISPSDYAIDLLENIIFQYIHLLIDLRMANKFVEFSKSYFKTNVVPEKLSLFNFRTIILNLIKEKVPVFDISLIFDKISEFIEYTTDTDIISEKLRKELSWFICKINSNVNGKIFKISLSNTEVEQILNKESAKISEIKKLITDFLVINNEKPVIIIPAAHRLEVYRILSYEMPYVIVMADDEIEKDFTLLDINDFN